MKNLLVFGMILAIAGLFFHDKQQTADLDKAQVENGQLKTQVDTDQAAITQLQQKVEQLTAQAMRAAAQGNATQLPAAQSSYRSPLTTDHLQGSGYH